MRKLIIVVASLLVVVLLILQGFQQTYPLPEPENTRQAAATGEGVEDAMDAIYFDVSIMGVQQATADAIRLINEAAPGEGVLKIKALEAFTAAANGKATKIIIPSEIQGLAGLAAGAKTIFDTEDPKA